MSMFVPEKYPSSIRLSRFDHSCCNKEDSILCLKERVPWWLEGKLCTAKYNLLKLGNYCWWLSASLWTPLSRLKKMCAKCIWCVSSHWSLPLVSMPLPSWKCLGELLLEPSSSSASTAAALMLRICLLYEFNGLIIKNKKAQLWT